MKFFLVCQKLKATILGQGFNFEIKDKNVFLFPSNLTKTEFLQIVLSVLSTKRIVCFN